MSFAALSVIEMYVSLALLRCGRLGRCLVRVEPAQSTVEYALIGALIVVVASAAVVALGSSVNTVFQNLSTALRSGRAGG
jgi:Flp pilus assembly pilin Flp